MTVALRRAYDRRAGTDGYHVLVDRLWPRGIDKAALGVDEWLKTVAPSSKLRKWFGHDADKWDEFKRRYFEELDAQPRAIARLIEKAREGEVTLVFAAKDPRFSNAHALKDYLVDRLR